MREGQTSTPNPGKFGAVAEGDLYQPETRPEPVKKGGVFPNILGGFRVHTPELGTPPCASRAARTCAVWCWLMYGSYGQGEGTNGGRLRLFSSAQAPWRVLLQALDRHQILESGIWDSIVRYKSERGVLDKSKISRGGSFF